MPQSLVKNYIHITFSTKNRYPFIDDTIEDELFSYLGRICKNLECNPIIIGGYKDHIHILCLLSRKMSLMNLIEKVKSHSSKCPPAALQVQQFGQGLKQKESSIKNSIGKVVTVDFRFTLKM